MNFDPKDPVWPNRDRFILSNGHASMLLWSVLHLVDVQMVNVDYERLGQPSVTLDDIRRFRQLDSKAPGHPRVSLGLGRRDQLLVHLYRGSYQCWDGNRPEVARQSL